MTYEDLDAKLINALLGDGRASLRSLAEELDVSVTTVSNRLRDLEDEGVIEGYTPQVNYGALGHDVTVVIQLKVEGSALSKITGRLRAEKQMISVYEAAGDYDIIAISKFHDTDGVNTQIKKLFTDADTREFSTSVVLNAVTENERFDLDLEEQRRQAIRVFTSHISDLQ